jgi:hypothetical protein
LNIPIALYAWMDNCSACCGTQQSIVFPHSGRFLASLAIGHVLGPLIFFNYFPHHGGYLGIFGMGTFVIGYILFAILLRVTRKANTQTQISALTVALNGKYQFFVIFILLFKSYR